MNEPIFRRLARNGIRYGSYPLLLGLTLAYLHHELSGKFARPLGDHYPAYLAVTIGLMLLLEWSAPMRSAWAMTWRSFLHRDIPLAVTNGTAMAATTLGLTTLAQHFRVPHWHLAASLPWWAGALIAIGLSDVLWYWLHRLSHEAGGRVGDWLWRMHVVHHLPAQVYVLMHPVSHPINSILVRAILMLPGLALGLSPEAVFVAGVLTSFQGLVSHFNVDSRAGWLNYLLIGTELHREHHSAQPSEALNYGAVISLWDLLFGTFRYRPGRAPAALGVEAPDRYPQDHEWLKLMALPLRRSRLT
jgi:sterol desaturase/sphingolipid hydroxylase (fatty acid hydroxylase superfamily)